MDIFFKFIGWFSFFFKKIDIKYITLSFKIQVENKTQWCFNISETNRFNHDWSLFCFRVMTDIKYSRWVFFFFWWVGPSSLYLGNDLLEYSPYEPVNSRLSDIFRLAPIIAGKLHTADIPTASGARLCMVGPKPSWPYTPLLNLGLSRDTSVTPWQPALFCRRLWLSAALIHHKSFYLPLWPRAEKHTHTHTE